MSRAKDIQREPLPGQRLVAAALFNPGDRDGSHDYNGNDCRTAMQAMQTVWIPHTLGRTVPGLRGTHLPLAEDRGRSSQVRWRFGEVKRTRWFRPSQVALVNRAGHGMAA